MITDNILEPIFNAFAEVEKHDIRVKRVVLKRGDYYKIATSKSFMFLNRYINNPALMNANLQNSHKYIGQLCGIGVELGNESKVYGEYGFYPRLSESQLSFSSEYSVKIDFDGFKYRLKCQNLTIIVKTRSDFFYKYSESEWKAIETLREMITESEFRKYIKYGFILVKGKSGNIYQIFRKSVHTKVWRNGKIIEEICVRIKDTKIPVTDNLIAFKIMIETDEQEFKRLGNIYKMSKVA